jgi:tetratricopeptide (TPR) repeat protein
MRAQALARAGKTTEAMAVLNEIVRRIPKHADALHHLGVLSLQSGKAELAVGYLRRAAAAAPSSALIQTHLGAALRRHGDLEAAVKHHRHAIRLDPALAAAHGNLGNALRDQGIRDEAESCFREALRLQPSFLDAQLNLGLLLVDLERNAEAEAALRAVVERAPKHVKALFELGNLLRRQHRYNEAREAYEAVLAVNPADAPTLINLAATLQASGRVHETPALFQRALAVAPNLPEVHVGLGGVLHLEGRTAEAEAAYRHAISLAPNNAAAYRGLSGLSIDSLTAHEVAEIGRLVETGSLTEEDHVGLLFALARIREVNGDHDGAFELATRGNKLVRRTLNFDADSNDAYLQACERVFSKDFFAARPWGGSDSQAPTFIVGLPRSGTTLVEQILAAHPRVAAAGEVVEMPDIARDLPKLAGVDQPYPLGVPALDQAGARKLADRYLAYVHELGAEGERITDKLPFNFRLLGLIALLFPRSRVLHCRRDPRDVAVSCYLLNFLRPISFTYDFEDFGRYHRAYERIMAHWKRVLPIPMLDVQYEELVGDQEGGTRALLEFCGLEWDDRCLQFNEVERPVWTASTLQVRQPMYSSSIGRWRRFEKHLEPLIRALGHDTPGAPAVAENHP